MRSIIKRELYLQIFALLILCAVFGCGKTRPNTIQVHGKVTLNGGKWPGKGAVYFQNTKAAPGFMQRPGRGLFDEEGNFVAGTYGLDDGLVPGEYDVMAVFKKPYISGDDIPPNSSITGNDKLTVPADAKEPIKYQFDVKHK